MKVQLPGGRIVELPKKKLTPRAGDTKEMLYGGARAVLRELGLDPNALTLAEFHALRALVTHEGWLEEEEVEIECRNCDETIAVKPCAAMPIGPFVDAELDDEELDALLDVSLEHDVPALGKKIRFRALTAKDAEPLHRALAHAPLHVTPEVASAMGIVSLGETRESRKIARQLQRCDDRAFGEITNLFLRAHYPLRLFSLVMCEHCGTRNDIDAPYDREFPPSEDLPEKSNATLPSFDEFDALSRKIGEELIAKAPPPTPVLIVEGGVPDCDDGGEPLMGSYVPGHEGDARSPSNPGTITIYYRTFASMWKDDGAYDIEGEIFETIEHELEHHDAHLVGHDPKDEEERDEIAREARRVVGKRALARAATNAFASDIGEFWKRTWPAWVLALIAVAIAILASR
ncbi:MAG TPA: hypothetical protein VH054_19840 [Polyangiaceae bacterium]|jgi:hypothetical protein|nr:hypothetical protein [Polyangiaceae bacterium]